MNKTSLKHILILIFISLHFSLSAQWTCPTKLNAHLKPMWSDSPLSWATETTVGAGILDDRIINNEMFFGGLEYYNDRITIYAEGGLKYWSLWEDGTQLDKLRLGMREAYINTHFGKSEIKLGLQSLQFDEQFLFNERAIGLSFNRNHNGIKLEAAIGTVAENFARNGSFCSKCYLYDIVKDRAKPFLGANPMDENFAAFVLSVTPSKRKKKSEKPEVSSTDEFESFDEFSSGDEFSETEEFGGDAKTNKMFSWISVESYGALAYSEFGNFRPIPRVWLGVYETIQLPFNIKFKGEYLYQQQDENRGVVLVNSFLGDFKCLGGITDWNASYYYFIGIDENANTSLSYTNLFLGEVLRLDAIEVPLASVYLKHRFIGKGMSLKLQYASSFNTDLSEFDLQFNKNIGKNFHLITTAGYIKAPELKSPLLGRLEVRFTF